MTTAQNIIDRALLDLQVIEGGSAPSYQESADALVYLNDLLQAWSNEGLTIYSTTTEGFTLTGATSYTMGSGATFNTSRPVRILSAYFTLNSIDYPVSIINRDEYEAIADKSSTGDVPMFIYVNYGAPNVTIYVYPVCPSGTLNLSSEKPLSSIATLGTSLSLPNGYERALRLALAVELMPQYGIMNQLIMANASKAKSDIKRVNSANNQVLTGLGLPVYYKKGNILDGP